MDGIKQKKKTKTKAAATLWAIFLGNFGAHKFYLGSWGWGIIYFLFSWTSIPAIISMVEWIKYILLSEKQFSEKVAKINGPFNFLW